MIRLKLKSLFASLFALVPMLLCAVLLSGCGEKQFDSVLTIDGEPVDPATYRMYQIQSYFEAAQQVSSLADTIDGVNAVEWINRNTQQLLRERRYYDQAFEQSGLSFTSAEQEEIEQTSAESWASAGPVYLRNGVDQQTFFAYQLSAARQNALFDQFCADLTDEEIRNYLDEQFVFIEYVQLPRFDVSGDPLGEDELEELQTLAQNTLRKMRSGTESFSAACAEAVSASYALGGFSAPDLNDTDSYIFSSYLSRLAGNENVAGLVEEVGKTAIDSFGSYTDEQFILIFHRLPNWETEDDFEALRPSVLWQMRGADFEAQGAAVWENYTLQTDAEALDWYQPQKLDLSAPTEQEQNDFAQGQTSNSTDPLVAESNKPD